MYLRYYFFTYLQIKSNETYYVADVPYSLALDESTATRRATLWEKVTACVYNEMKYNNKYGATVGPIKVIFNKTN